MARTTEETLLSLMVVTAASADGISQRELNAITGLVNRLPAFEGFAAARIAEVANETIERLHGADGLERIVSEAVAELPPKLQETAYALCVEVAVVDLALPQEELRFLEMLRDHMHMDRLLTAAIEASARVRMRRLQP